MWLVEFESIPPDYVGKGKRRKKIPILGLADSPKDKDRTITINPNQSKREICISCAHEFGHAYSPNVSEKETERRAHDLGAMLWKCGIRLRTSDAKIALTRQSRSNRKAK